MKRENLTIIATIIVAFIISMFAFQPTATEASNNVSPSATPSPRRKRIKAIQSPKPIQSPITTIRTKKPSYKEGGVNDTTYRTRQPRRKRGIPAPTPSPITKQIGVPAPTPSPED